MLRFLSILTVAHIALAGCEKPNPEVEFDKPAATTVRMMPDDERTMIVIVQRAHQAFVVAGSNELQARLTRPARALELCEFFKSTSVRNWTGVISHLSTDNDDRGILTIKVADDIEIGTWHSAVSDTHRTLIEPDSAVYRSTLELRKGTPVIFSGEFFRKDSDCLYESSVTLRASMTAPTFIFKFTNVGPISN
jgi:hypothetical protein